MKSLGNPTPFNTNCVPPSGDPAAGVTDVTVKAYVTAVTAASNKVYPIGSTCTIGILSPAWLTVTPFYYSNGQLAI